MLIIKQGEEFHQTFFGTGKYNCVMKTSEMFTFLPLISKSLTIGSRYSLLIISTIISSNTINTLHFFKML